MVIVNDKPSLTMMTYHQRLCPIFVNTPQPTQINLTCLTLNLPFTPIQKPSGGSDLRCDSK